MNSIKVCFWNLQNLFDTTLSELALDFDYTPANGWYEAVRDIKIDNLVKGISSTFSSGPDLIGMCEIENEYLAQEIATKLNRNLNRNDYSVAKYKDKISCAVTLDPSYSSNLPIQLLMVTTHYSLSCNSQDQIQYLKYDHIFSVCSCILCP